jgi:hypothetical protein
MVRMIAAGVLGYLTILALVMLTFAVVFVAPDFAFEPDSWEVTPGWLAYTLTMSFLAACAGGLVAVLVARGDRRPALWLAAVVMLLGLAGAASQLSREPPPPMGGSAKDPMTRGAEAVQPTWYALLLPFLGAAGVLAGASRYRGTDN